MKKNIKFLTYCLDKNIKNLVVRKIKFPQKFFKCLDQEIKFPQKLTISTINVKMITLKNLTVCYYHVMLAFQSKSTLCSCLNVKELLAISEVAKELFAISEV